MKTLKHALLPLALCTLAACAGAPPRPVAAWYSSKAADHPRYPHARYLTGAGLSTLDQAQADAAAKTEVAAQISARIQAETRSFSEYTTAGGTREQLTATTDVKVDFDRGDLIHVVDHDQSGGTFYSYAALDRAQADREFASEMAGSLASFTAAAQSACKAYDEGQTGVFASGSAEARKAWREVYGGFVRRRAVAGHPSAEEAPAVALYQKMLADLADLRAHEVIGVVMKGHGDGRLSDLAVNAVKRLGLRPDTRACEARPRTELTAATELEVEPVEKCEEASLGEKCEVTVHLVAQACAGGTAGEGTVPMTRGIHPSDRDRARRSAWDKITEASVEAAVREALKSALQLGE